MRAWSTTSATTRKRRRQMGDEEGQLNSLAMLLEAGRDPALSLQEVRLRRHDDEAVDGGGAQRHC